MSMNRPFRAYSYSGESATFSTSKRTPKVSMAVETSSQNDSILYLRVGLLENNIVLPYEEAIKLRDTISNIVADEKSFRDERVTVLDSKIAALKTELKALEAERDNY